MQPANRRGEKTRSNAEPGVDLDEDLFDFASVAPPAGAPAEEDLDEIFASFRAGSSSADLFDVPAAASATATAEPGTPALAPPPEPRAPLPSPAGTARALPEPETAAGEPVRTARALHEELSAASAPAAPLPSGRKRFPRGTVLVAVAVTLLNSALAVVLVRAGPPDARATPPEEHASEHDVEARETPAPRPESAAPLPDPETLDVVHAHPTLDRAREEIRRGEYSAARQRVYGLLAIVDRLEEPRRGALEADCQFLIAEALHLEALSRMGAPR